MISCETSGRSVMRGVCAAPGATRTSSCAMATRSNSTVPLSVCFWPNASQSARTRTPARRVGVVAITRLCVGRCQAETTMRSEPTEPDEKLLRPLNVQPSSASVATARWSSGFSALPQNRRCATVSSSWRFCCDGAPYNSSVATCR